MQASPEFCKALPEQDMPNARFRMHGERHRARRRAIRTPVVQFTHRIWRRRRRGRNEVCYETISAMMVAMAAVNRAAWM
jgi:hypothetical protein